MSDTTKKVYTLGADAAHELWCWLWGGIAERERRIWCHLESSRDIRHEKGACLDVLAALTAELPTVTDQPPGEALFARLGFGLDEAGTERLTNKLEAWGREAREEASGNEMGGNWADAMDLVLERFMPHFYSLTTPGRAAQRHAPGLDLTPAGAYEYLAWLGCSVQELEAAKDEAKDPGWAQDLATGLAALRLALGQFVASVPEGPDSYFQSTWGGLRKGLGADRVRPFAGWLGAEADCAAAAGGIHATILARGHRRLAEVAGVTPEELRSLAPPCPPPWQVPEAMLRAYLGGHAKSGELVSVTIVERAGKEDRYKVPLHQFLAGLSRG